MIKLSSQKLFTKAISIILLFFTASTTMAQENKPSIKYNLFSVDGVVISDTILLNNEYEKKYNIPIKIPFKIQVPRQKGVKRYVEYGEDGTSMIIKFNFATGGNSDIPQSERKLIEDVQFISMNIPMKKGERIKILTSLMINEAFEMATAAYKEKEYLGARLTKINGIDVIDSAGKYISPELGLVYVRMTGYLNPNGINSIYSIANIVANKYEITNLDQLFLTNSGKTISSFEYIN